jgi:hypothetical protein
MNDKKLKDMWNKAEQLSDAPGYESQRIEQFVSGRSTSIARKVKNMIQLDIGLKVLVAIVFLIDAAFYANTTSVLILCIIGAIVILPLILFETNVLKQFSETADSAGSTKEQLSAMLTFLKTRFFATLISISSTYIFVFVSGVLIYFYTTYGYVRTLDLQDIVVFSVFILIGIIMNYLVNSKQVKYHIKHLETCLSDLNDNVLEVVSQNIEIQQKHDRTTKLLLMFVLVFGFVLLIAILKSAGM